MSRRLHIGGQTQSAGWEVLNANPAPYVDHVCNASDLSLFAASTFAEIYASHVVEHFDYAGELQSTLAEWHRVLEPGGKLFVSVPDLDTLSELFLSKDGLSFDERFFVMRMIFGGHVDKYDYHVVGLNEEFLRAFLSESEFVNIRRVELLGVFEDTSSMRFRGRLISLNMIAEKRSTLSSSAEDARQQNSAQQNSGQRNPGRNEPCPCGSGSKFKHCHGKIG